MIFGPKIRMSPLGYDEECREFYVGIENARNLECVPTVIVTEIENLDYPGHSLISPVEVHWMGCLDGHRPPLAMKYFMWQARVIKLSAPNENGEMFLGVCAIEGDVRPVDNIQRFEGRERLRITIAACCHGLRGEPGNRVQRKFDLLRITTGTRYYIAPR
jgi:hypothetical protein